MAPRGRRTAQDGRESAEGTPDTPWLDERAAAARLGVHVNTMRAWRLVGAPAVQVGRVIGVGSPDNGLAFGVSLADISEVIG